MNEVIKAIKSRRSIRNYSTKQISQEHLEMIIEAGIYAPSAINEQPWHFTVIQNQELLNHINDVVKTTLAESGNQWLQDKGRNPDFMVTYHAPALIVISGNEKAYDWKADCSFAMENMMLAGESLGIGSVCLGFVSAFLEKEEEVAKLGIPDGYKPYYGIAFGYKADDKVPEAPERNRNVVNYIK